MESCISPTAEAQLFLEIIQPTKQKAWEYFNLGMTCRKLGKFEEAIKNLKKAKEINKLRNKFTEALTSEELSFIYARQAQYQNALKFANEALTIFKEIGYDRGEANSYASFGRIYSRLGKFSEAIDYLNKAAAILIKNDEKYLAGSAFINLAESYNWKREHEKALRCSQIVVKIAAKIGDVEILYSGFLNMGNAYLGLLRFTEAIENCEKSLNLCTKRQKVMHAVMCEAMCYGVMANTYKGLGQHQKAITNYKKSFEMNQKIENNTDTAIACGNLGQCYLETVPHQTSNYKSFSECLENSIKYLKQAIQIIDKQFFDLAVDKNKTSFCDRFYHWHVTLTFAFILTGRNEAALLCLDLGKAKVLKMHIQQQRKSVSTPRTGRYLDDSWISIEVGREKQRLTELSKDIQLQKSGSTVVTYTFDNVHRLIIWALNQDGSVGKQLWTPRDTSKSALVTLRAYIKILLGIVSVRIPREYSFFNQLSSTTELQTEQQIFKSTALDDKAGSIIGDDTKMSPSDKTVPNANSTSEKLQPTSSDNNTNLVNGQTQSRAPQHEDQMSDGKSGSPNVKPCDQILSYLYQALVGPVKDVIKGNKLIIVPHDCLFFVPFSSLIDENGFRLSEKYQVQITPSLHTLASSMKDEESNEIGISLFVGNPKIEEVSFEGRPVI